DVADRVVDRQAVGHVAAGAVDEEGNGPIVLAGQLAQALDAGPRGVLLDVTDEIDVAQPLRSLLAPLGAHHVYELGDSSIAQFFHPRHYRIDSSSAALTQARNRTRRRG